MIKIKYMYSRNPPNKNTYYVCHDKSDLRTSPLALARKKDGAHSYVILLLIFASHAASRIPDGDPQPAIITIFVLTLFL